MAEIDINKGNLSNQVYTGTVQMAFPSLGWAVVIPAGATADKALLCRLPANGGILGGGVTAAPVTGTLVTYRRQKDTDKGYIVSQNPQGNQPSIAAQSIMLHNYPQMQGISLTLSADNLAQYVQTITHGKEHATYIGGQEDQFQGDVYVGDRYGPGVFYGRAQVTIKGSDLSYIQMSAIDDKITTVTTDSQLYTFTDKQSITSNLNKYLKAANSFQGMGGRPWQGTDEDLLQGDPKIQIKLKDKTPDPLYRLQLYQGGAAQGSCFSVIGPLQEKKQEKPVLISDIKTFDGQQMQMSVQGQTSIKTAYTTGLVDFKYSQPLKTETGKKELQQRTQNYQALLKQFQNVTLSDDGLERVAQIDAILNEDSRGLIANMMGTEALELLWNQVEPLSDPYGWDLNWEGDQEPKLEQDKLGNYQTVSTTDKFTGKTTKRFKNNSIITQDPDGTITLKDGWGSQITMSHGNIYISSALDTFIRPGRDLIAMIPRHISMSANGQIQLGSKEHIKAGAEKDLVLASGIGGESGYTVLENRTAKGQAGMVIRSNGKLTLTSSDDMHIGINDKRTQNLGDAANQGEGSIFIQGKAIRVESKDQLRLLGKQTGIYACDNTTGTGIQLNQNSITVIAPSTNVDTSSLLMGKFQTSYTINTGAAGENSVTLAKGGDTLVVQVRGRIQSRDIVCAGNLQVSGTSLAQDYIILKTKSLDEIPGVKESTIRTFRNQISRAFNTPLTAPTLPFRKNLQEWYNDNYICNRQLRFKNDWIVPTMPTMCWQLQKGADPYDILESIQVQSTGGDEGSVTCTYPGSFGWDSCTMFTLEQGSYKPDYQVTIRSGYKTYTKKGN